MTHDDALAIQGWLLALAPYFTTAILVWLTLRNGARIKETKVAIQEGTAVSRGNAEAIKEVSVDVKNGYSVAAGVAATEAAQKVVNVAGEAAQEVVTLAKGVATKLVEEVTAKLADEKTYSGEDRRIGPEDRRQPDDKPK